MIDNDDFQQVLEVRSTNMVQQDWRQVPEIETDIDEIIACQLG